jgi:hypothetical protein
LHYGSLGHFSEEIFDYPVHRLLALPAARIQTLVKVASAVEESHRNHRHLRSAAARIVSPARTPKPPLYVGSPSSNPISMEKYAIGLFVIDVEL